jgi:hypothetical protein
MPVAKFIVPDWGIKLSLALSFDFIPPSGITNLTFFRKCRTQVCKIEKFDPFTK